MQHELHSGVCNEYSPGASLYPAFFFKAPGIVADSEEKSTEQESALCEKLVGALPCGRYKFRRNLFWLMFNHRIPSILQGFRRPMCGLVALQMAACMLKKLKSHTPQYTSEEILDAAVGRGITKQGEMFSVFIMANLAKDLYNCEASIVDLEASNHRFLIMKHLLEGHPILMPYDNDRNYEPCQRKGHCAHWALVTGAVLPDTIDLVARKKLEPLPGVSRVYKIEDKGMLLDALRNNEAENSAEFYCQVHVFAKQGKSSRCMLWSLEDLLKSNSNLVERNPSKDWNQLHCPYSLKETLRNKFIILHFKAEEWSSQQ